MNLKNINKLLKLTLLILISGQVLIFYEQNKVEKNLTARQLDLQNKYNNYRAQNDRLKDPSFLAKKSSLQNSQTSEKELIFTIGKDDN